MLQTITKKPSVTFLLKLALIALISTGGTVIRADDSVNEDRSVIQEEVRTELRRLINEESLLDKAIERGISAYIQKKQALARASKQREGNAKAKNVRPVGDNDHIYGNPSAAISLIEYSDFECPYCKRFHPTSKKLVDNASGDALVMAGAIPLSRIQVRVDALKKRNETQ